MFGRSWCAKIRGIHIEEVYDDDDDIFDDVKDVLERFSDDYNDIHKNFGLC